MQIVLGDIKKVSRNSFCFYTIFPIFIAFFFCIFCNRYAVIKMLSRKVRKARFKPRKHFHSIIFYCNFKLNIVWRQKSGFYKEKMEIWRQTLIETRLRQSRRDRQTRSEFRLMMMRLLSLSPPRSEWKKKYSLNKDNHRNYLWIVRNMGYKINLWLNFERKANLGRCWLVFVLFFCWINIAFLRFFAQTNH